MSEQIKNDFSEPLSQCPYFEGKKRQILLLGHKNIFFLSHLFQSVYLKWLRSSDIEGGGHDIERMNAFGPEKCYFFPPKAFSLPDTQGWDSEWSEGVCVI